ncbi:MAG: hypothetical protein WBQ73_01700 [Candidatus Babeliales bacterium]
MHKLFKTSILTIAIIIFSLPLHAAENNKIYQENGSWITIKSSDLPKSSPKKNFLKDKYIYDRHLYMPDSTLCVATEGSEDLLNHLMTAFDNDKYGGWLTIIGKDTILYQLPFTYCNEPTLKNIMYCCNEALNRHYKLYNEERFNQHLKSLTSIMLNHFDVDKQTNMGLSKVIGLYTYSPFEGNAIIALEDTVDDIIDPYL